MYKFLVKKMKPGVSLARPLLGVARVAGDGRRDGVDGPALDDGPVSQFRRSASAPAFFRNLDIAHAVKEDQFNNTITN